MTYTKIPNCVKCFSTFQKLETEPDGYYLHCRSCGLLTLLQSRVHDTPVIDDVDLNQLDPDEHPVPQRSRAFHKLSMAYWAIRALYEYGPMTVATIAVRMGKNYPSQKPENITKNLAAHLNVACKEYKAVRIDTFKSGVKGSSVWTLGDNYEQYLAKYQKAETIEGVKPLVTTPIEVVPSKPKTLAEILQGQRIKPPLHIAVLYG